MDALTIGIDCATDEAKVGLALAEYRHGVVELLDVASGAHGCSVVATLTEWLQRTQLPRLLALDAPLGWPAPLGPALSEHHAGDLIDQPPDQLFRRETDSSVQSRCGKRPLDVGADRIGRTAHAALRLLGELRDRLNVPIPVLWEPMFTGIGAIEVYPAATLIAHRYRSAGYKRPGRLDERQQIIESLAGDIRIGGHRPVLEDDADQLDAVVCVLAAKDFLDGRAVPPQDRALAEKEGWIWVASRSPSA